MTDRRNVLRGAAWSAPILAAVAATPLAAASTTTSPDGITAAISTASSSVAHTTKSVGNRAPLALPAVLYLDTKSVDSSVYGHTAPATIDYTITMSSGATYTSPSSSLAVQVGSVQEFPAASFSNVVFASGTYIVNGTQVRPVSVRASLAVSFSPTDGSPTIASSYQLNWTITGYYAGTITPSFLGGNGDLNFTGTVAVA